MPDNISRNYSRLFYTVVSGTDLSGELDRTYQKNWVNVRNGVSNPKWRQQIAARQNATTVLTGTKLFLNWRPGYARWNAPIWGPNWVREFYGTVLALSHVDSQVVPEVFPGSLHNEVDAVALSRFIDACVNAQRSFQGSTFFGELRETLQMLKNPARALRRGITQFSRDAKKHLKNSKRKSTVGTTSNTVSKGLSGLWLEHFFGWAPLINDIKSAMETLNRYDPNPTIDVRTGYKKSQTAFTTFNTNYFGDYCDFVKAQTHYSSVRYKGEVWATAPYLRDFGPVSQWGFDPIRDFIPTVYELIPYSFLLDYFTNLGTVVQSWCFWSGNLSWYCRTWEKRSTCNLNGVRYYRLDTNTFKLQSSSPERHTCVRREVRRDIPSTLIPSITFELPGSGLKWLNIAALANERR